MEDAEVNDFAYRLKRDAGGFVNHVIQLWEKRWFKALVIFVGLALLTWLLIWAAFARDLPDAEDLLTYEPPLPTTVRAYDGEPIHSYARERRVQLEYSEFPRLLVRAYLSAEDRTFFDHGGLDYPGIAAAIISNLSSSGRPVGASTITQQVAKNLLLTNEVSYRRKVREAILAYRIENALSKQQILELYLNQIFLGRNAYGVQAAARAYFGKDVDDLALHEMAYLAILPKGPSNYRPENNEQRALDRRNWVLGAMLKNGWITESQKITAAAQPLGAIARSGPRFERVGDYFVEAVRRELIEKFGETDKDGQLYSVYAGGLWVRTSLHPQMQRQTTRALRDGLLRYDRGKAWKGPINRIEIDDKWAQRLASTFIDIDYANWQVAVVLSRIGSQATVGFVGGKQGRVGNIPRSLTAGDIVAVAPLGGNSFALKRIPEVSGGMVVQNPRNGRVYAMQGGFDSRISSFNRAIQANRQPGSTIKPFVYATALDQGMTPATIVVDSPFCVYQSASLGRKCFRNFGGARGAGAQTLRWGVEQSRNLMTVRTANDAGMENVVKTIDTMGIGNYNPYLAFALGAGDTTVMKLTNAYSMLANHGRELKPSLIDIVQDRNGKVIFRADTRVCERCNMDDWDGEPMPRLRKTGRQLMDAMTAYQTVHILEGVVLRGTAQNLRDLNRPLFGKTGTTSGPTNVWFVGGSADVVAGVYMGFDTPRNLGGYAQGGTLAAPIFKQFAKNAFANMPVRPFRAPKGIRMVRIDRKSGKRVFGRWPDNDPKGAVIWEAFKPETEPNRTIRTDEIEERQAAVAVKRKKRAVTSDNDFLAQEGGIY